MIIRIQPQDIEFLSLSVTDFNTMDLSKLFYELEKVFLKKHSCGFICLKLCYTPIFLRPRKKVLILVIGRVDFDRPQNITRHRLHLSIIDDQQSSWPLQKHVVSLILTSKMRYYCLACFATIPATREMFSQVALDI